MGIYLAPSAFSPAAVNQTLGMNTVHTGPLGLVSSVPASPLHVSVPATAPDVTTSPFTPHSVQSTGTTGGNGNGGGGGGGGYVAPSAAAPAAPIAPTSAQLAQPLATLASLDSILANKQAQTNDEYNKTMSGYNAQDAIDKQNYDDQTHTNNETLARNNQAALLNAVNASTGLRGVLSSTGGLAGSGEDVVRRLTGLAANADAGAARQTFDGNAKVLNNAWETTDQAEKQRKANADATHADDLQNDQAQVLNTRQGLLQTLAGLWGADTSQGKDYASQAAALAGPIAATTRATVAPYQAQSSLYTPAALAQYLAGTKNLDVNTSAAPASVADGPAINSPQYAQKKTDTLAGVA